MSVQAIPHGYHTLVPYLHVPSAAAAIDFYVEALGAVETLRLTMPGGAIAHAEVKIGDSAIMLGDENPQWKIYAFTDRTAYRPGDKVHWKFFARTYQHGQYANASGRTVEWEIHDPQGAKIKEGKSPLEEIATPQHTAQVMPKGRNFH